jgi:hypothetical protein
MDSNSCELQFFVLPFPNFRFFQGFFQLPQDTWGRSWLKLDILDIKRTFA